MLAGRGLISLPVRVTHGVGSKVGTRTAAMEKSYAGSVVSARISNRFSEPSTLNRATK